MNATRPKKNVAGYVDEQGRFRPIRSPQYIGSRKATAKDRKKYSPAKAGDLGKSKQERALEAPWDTEMRLEREAAERKKRDQDRIMREIEGEAFGTGESRKKGYTLLQFVRSAGGIRRTFRHGGKKGVGKYGKRSSWDSGEIDRLSFKETGKRGLTTDQPNKGRTMDKMFQAARESGYDVTSIDDMMERIESEAAGSSPTYATHGSLSYNPKSKAVWQKHGTNSWVARDSAGRAVAQVIRVGYGAGFLTWNDSAGGGSASTLPAAKRKALAGLKPNPAGPDWGMRVCANCDKYTANADLKKLGEINVCKACHKKLTASKAAKSQASLFDDQGSLFNPKAAAKLNPGMAWEKYNHKWFLTYRGETLAIVTQNNPNSYSVEGERGSSRTLTLAKQKALRVGKAALKSVKAKLMTDAEMISVVNRYGSKAIIKKHGKAVGVRAAGGFNTDKWKVRFADGTEIETRIPKRNPAVKKNPDGITMFAQLASGVASALQVREMLNRKPAAKKRKTTRRKNPTTVAKANPRKQVTVPARGDYYLLTIGSGDDIMAVYLQDGDKDGFSKRFKTVAAAKSYATKKRLRLKANPKAIKVNSFRTPPKYAGYTNDQIKDMIAAKKRAATIFTKDRARYEREVRQMQSELRKRNPASVVGKAAKKVSDAYYLNPFIDGVYLSHGTTLGRKFATQAAARKYARDHKICLSNPTRKAVAAKTRAKAVANPVARKRNVRLDRHGRQTVHTLTCAKCKRQEQAASMATLERRADRDQWLVGSGRNGSKTLCRDCRFQKPKKNNPTPKTPAKRVANPGMCRRCGKWASEGVLDINGGFCKKCEGKPAREKALLQIKNRNKQPRKISANPAKTVATAKKLIKELLGGKLGPIVTWGEIANELEYAGYDFSTRYAAIRAVRSERSKKAPRRNPTPKVKAQKPKTNGSRPRSALYEKFQGRKPERLSKTLASEHAPQTLVQLGKLHEVKLMGVREAIKFNPSRVRLCAAHGKLWITGAKIDRPDPKQNPGTVHPIAEIDHVVYETWKPHHGDQPGQRYIHKLGEWSGNRPTLCVDREGYPVIKGGAYTIEDRGIVD